MGKQQYINTKLEITVNNIIPECIGKMEPFYYVNQYQMSIIEVCITQIIKANKPPMNTYAKSEMLLHRRMLMNKNNVIIDGALLLEMYNIIYLKMYGSISAGSRDLSSQTQFRDNPERIS